MVFFKGELELCTLLHIHPPPIFISDRWQVDGLQVGRGENRRKVVVVVEFDHMLFWGTAVPRHQQLELKLLSIAVSNTHTHT